MIWTYFTELAFATALVWLLAILLWVVGRSRMADKIALTLSSIGLFVLTLFVVLLWIDLERPPMRTLGETRLWYSMLLPLTGILIYLRWRYKWLLSYTLAMAILFLVINIWHPETYSKTLMPALQSIWFIPHVLVYMVAYAVLAASSFVAFKGILDPKKHVSLLPLADNLVYIGFGFLTLGLLFGALWAKTAWGNYWSWDPKEVWAFLTWLGYMMYIHYRYFKPHQTQKAFYILIAAFVILFLCWFWVNYSPVAQNSVHTYTNY